MLSSMWLHSLKRRTQTLQFVFIPLRMNSNADKKPTSNLRFNRVESTQQLSKMLRIDAFVNAGMKEEKLRQEKKETMFDPIKLQASTIKVLKKNHMPLYDNSIKFNPEKSEKRWLLDTVIKEIDRMHPDERTFLWYSIAQIKRDYDFLKNFDLQVDSNAKLSTVFDTYMEQVYSKATPA